MPTQPTKPLFGTFARAKLGEVEFTLGAFDPSRLNPFKDERIHSIWDKEFADIGLMAYDEERSEMASKPQGHFGEAFLLIAKRGVQEELAGISGYFPLQEDGSERILLRWHGVREMFRGMGASQWMIGHTQLRAAKNFPEAPHLIEMMPDIPAYDHIGAAFSKMGFTRTAKVDVHDWSEHPWREWRLDLNPQALAKPPKANKIRR